MRQERKAEAGVAVVETAVVLSLLFIILFGVMEFATLFFNRAVIINASREGARFGSLFDLDTATGYVTAPKTDAEIIQKVNDYSAGHLISFSPSSGSVPTVSVSPTGVPPVSWTPNPLGEWRTRCQEQDELIHPSFASR